MALHDRAGDALPAQPDRHAQADWAAADHKDGTGRPVDHDRIVTDAKNNRHERSGSWVQLAVERRSVRQPEQAVTSLDAV